MKRTFITICLIFLSLPAHPQAWPDSPGAGNLPDPFDRLDPDKRKPIAPGRAILTRKEIDSLILPVRLPVQRFPTLEKFTDNEEEGLEFKRVSIFAPGSKILLMDTEGEHRLEHDARHFYIATNSTTGFGLAVDPETGDISGFVSKFDSKIEVHGNLLGTLEFKQVAEGDSNSCDTEMAGQPISSVSNARSDQYLSHSMAESGEIISYEAVVAVDTDNEWLAGFSNNENAAMTWITDAFLAMNVFFERDLETRLLIGDVTLRVSPDPYSESGNRSAQLDEFGEYWMNNKGLVERQFATMFSGRDVSPGYFSGIAWLDVYCEDGRTWGNRTVGSYSYNAIGAGRSAAGTALYIGHEIGHNMGSPHTHCYTPEIDRCFNGEDGCYEGAPECPVSGRGTAMSYCHVSGSSGANCGTSASEFHPRVQSLVEDRLSTELAAGCILPHTEPVLAPEVSSNPADGAVIDFGQWEVGQTSTSQSVTVDNTGTADLTVSCDLTGIDPASFNLVSCSSPISPGGSENVSVNCEPLVSGSLSANLEMSTDDEDEPLIVIGLLCQGEQVPLPELIFSSGFEQ
jgi:hypothetical protein